MTFDEFRSTLTDESPPPELDPLLRALWEDGRGNWDAAHSLVQDEDSAEAAWIHAYLHRKEGDLVNAGYWYRRCDRPVCKERLDEEWERITRALIG